MSFNPKDHLMKLKGKDYLPVAARLVWFRGEHPDWSIVTNPVEINMEKMYAIFTATILNADGRIIATATKTEDSKGFADFIEKAETGSVGRALAMCGYGTQFAPEFDEGNRLADSPIAPPNAPTYEELQNAKGVFVSAANKAGLVFHTATERGEWANLALGRDRDSRAGFSLDDWFRAAQDIEQVVYNQRHPKPTAQDVDATKGAGNATN